MRRQLLFSSLLLVCLLAGATGLLVLADGGAIHQSEQSRPIPLGVSGGSNEDFDFPFCCGGTAGALVEDASAQYILSNNHILARNNRATIGEDVVQPGLIDVGCNQNLPENVVADLSDFIPIDFDNPNLVDAAIAQVRSGDVQIDGSILDIGPLSPNALAGSVGLDVKKSGRTTGLTIGEIAAVDVSVSVKYPKKCGGRGGPSAIFVDQFRITPGSFSAGGDSGSAIVENIQNSPRAVGLLFAGSSSSTIANRIENVLSAFGVAMVGGTPPPPPATGSIQGTVTSIADSSPINEATVEVDTGQSTNTAQDGGYSLTDVPTGTRSVTVSKTGFVSDTQSTEVTDGGTAILNFALAEVSTPTNAIVDCVTYTTAGGRAKDKHVDAAVAIVDDLGNPVSGVNVTATITMDGSPVASSTVTTDSSGNAVFKVRNAADGCYQTDVTAVSGLTFDGSEPANGFAKGTDSTPDADCRSGGTDCGGAAFGKLIPAAQGKMRAAIALKRRYESFLFMRSKEVVGVGVTAIDGEPMIEVYLRSGSPRAFARIPSHVENVRVRPVVTGEFVARGQCQASQ